MLNLVSAAEQTPALALGSKSKYDFANSVRGDESVAHTSWSAFVAASAVRIAYVVCRQVVRCVDGRLSWRRADSPRLQLFWPDFPVRWWNCSISACGGTRNATERERAWNLTSLRSRTGNIRHTATTQNNILPTAQCLFVYKG